VLKRKGGAILHETVKKQPVWRRHEWWHLPRNLGAGKLVKVAVLGKHHWKGGKGHFPYAL
jgi:hypothetical protein